MGVEEVSERQASTFRKGQFTDSHVKVLAYLNQLGVSYKAEEVLHCWGMHDGKGRLISYKVDIFIDDSKYHTGVIEIDGKIHNKHWTKDEERDTRLRLLGLWIEHLPNKEVSLLAVSAILARHKI